MRDNKIKQKKIWKVLKILSWLKIDKSAAKLIRPKTLSKVSLMVGFPD